jgi:N-methylhydantoinase B
MSRTITDPITLEVIEHRLDSITREMANITLRTARSAVVHSGRDFSCSLFDSNAQLLAIGSSLPPHVMPMVVHLHSILAYYGGDVQPGDIFIGNDPHDGGTHLNDVLVCIPIYSGDDLMGFSTNRAHWADVGGSVPGSISGSATEIFQEGVRIPPMRIGRNDEIDEDILRFLCANVRLPHEVRGDLRSQLASCRVASQRVLELVDTYGVETVKATFAEILDMSERRMRSRIAELPDGTVMHEGYLDNDGTDTDSVLLRSTVTVAGDEITVDFTGSSEQRPGCTNTGLGVSTGYAFMAVKASLDPKGPLNGGTLRPMKVVVPEGTCLNSKPPAACGGLGELGQIMLITMVALSGLVPHHISTEEGASANHQNFDGTDPRNGNRFVFYDALSGGGGARATKDGMDFVRTLRSGNFTMMSVETLEKMFPLVFVKQELRTDSGGPGQFRGGLGMFREYRALGDAVISVLGDHAHLAPAGVDGGMRGAPTRWQVRRKSGDIVPVSPRFRSKGALQVAEGDVVRALTPGGGGWGDPILRDPEAVLVDVLRDKVSVDQAHDKYGVVITSSNKVDTDATLVQRECIEKKRTPTPLERGPAPVLVSGLRVAWVGADAPFSEGVIVEIFGPNRPQPLTLSLRSDDQVGSGALRLDAEAWRELGLGDGSESAYVRLVEDEWP